MIEARPELLNGIYREISDELGLEAAIKIYDMFRGQQISFPVKLFDSETIQKMICEEYDGTNIRALSIKYDYSEKSIRRIIKQNG